MRVRYSSFFIITNLLIACRIVSIEDPSIQKKDAFTKLSESFDNLTQESKNAIYEKGRQFIYNLLPTEWTWNKIFKPIVEQTNQYYYDKTKDVGLWAAGAAAIGATTYGLYRWATRRGMGGLVRAFQESDEKHGAIVNQLGKEIGEFTSKEDGNTLQPQDITLIKGIKVLITSKIIDLQGYIKQLALKMQQLNTFIQTDSAQPTTFQTKRSIFNTNPQNKSILNTKLQNKKMISPIKKEPRDPTDPPQHKINR